jgi:hypothetical protein
MGDANEEEMYKRAQMDEALRVQNATRKQQEDLAKYQAEQARKAAEEAAKKGNMVADEPAAPSWPDDGFQAEPGRLDGVKAALAIGAPGDAALAAKLLNTGHAPAGSPTAPATSADGAKEQTGSVAIGRTTSTALGY